MDFGLSQDQVLLKDTIAPLARRRVPDDARARRHGERDAGHDPALWRGARRARRRRPAGAAGARRRRARAARRRAGGRGARLGLHAGAVPRLRHGDGRALRERTTRRRSAAGCRASRPARRSPPSRSARRTASGTPTALATRADGGALTGREAAGAVRAQVADVLVVAAQDDAGPGLWLVERGRPGLDDRAAPGHRHDPAGGRRRASTARPAVKIAAGREAIDRARDAGLVLLAADAYGGARRCLDMTARYVAHARAVRAADRRLPGGEAPARRPRHRARAGAVALVVRGARLRPHPRPCRAPRRARQGAPHATSSIAPRASATELHGGIGFTWEYDLHLWFRRAIFDRAFLGERELPPRARRRPRRLVASGVGAATGGDRAVLQGDDAVAVAAARASCVTRTTVAPRRGWRRGAGRGSARRCACRGCRSARRRGSAPARSRARARSRPAASRRPTARRAVVRGDGASPTCSSAAATRGRTSRARRRSSSSGKRDVLLGRERRQQVEELEDEADPPTTEDRDLVVAHAEMGGAVDRHLARRRLVEPTDQVQQRALARAARAHDGDELAPPRCRARRRRAPGPRSRPGGKPSGRLAARSCRGMVARGLEPRASCV